MKNKQILINHLLDNFPTVAKRTLPWLAPIACQFSLERLFNSFFKQERAAGNLDFMQDKWVAIHVRDLDYQFSISLASGRKSRQLQVQQQRAQSDVVLTGNMEDLLLLMTQQVDPDTLFFRRKLSLRGDTELGLQLKNFLDTIELQTHLPKVIHTWSLLLAEQLNRRHLNAVH